MPPPWSLVFSGVSLIIGPWSWSLVALASVFGLGLWSLVALASVTALSAPSVLPVSDGQDTHILIYVIRVLFLSKEVLSGREYLTIILGIQLLAP